MDTAASDADPLAPLADEFLARCRRGEQPSPEEYAVRHPTLASQIRDLFPALLVMEHLGGPAAGAPPSLPALGPTASCRLGEYRILRQVGRGGMGVVYEAVQESLGRHVALKVLTPQLTSHGTYLERFKREAKAAARLHHTNIVPVFGVGEHDGTHYYAMQFIHGQGLDRVLDDVRRLRQQPLSGAAERGLAASLLTGLYDPGAATVVPADTSPPDSTPRPAGSQVLVVGKKRYFYEAARLGAQVAEGLAHAHAQGVLHRDIKPSNLLLDAQGALWITDFGLAKTDDSDNLTGTGDLVGTLRYMAPERFSGRADARSDVYALGVTLYEMLTLRPAFEETDRVRLMARVTGEVPPRPRRIDPEVPRDLETIVLKAMARDPADRYATATALAEDLHRFLADRPIHARRHRWPEQLWRWGRRNPVVAALTGAVAGLLLLLLAGFVVHSLHLGAALRESEERLFQSYLAEARARRVSGREGQRFAALEAVREAAALARKLGKPPESFEELRALAIAALAAPDVHSLTWDNPVPPNTTVIIDGITLNRVALLDASGNLTIRDIAGRTDQGRLTGREVRHALFDPDGRSLLVVQADGTVGRWLPETDTHEPLAQIGGPTPIPTEISRDGRRLLLVQSGAAETTYEVLDLVEGRALTRGTLSGEAAEGRVALSPDGRRLALVRGGYGTAASRSTRVIEIDTGKEVGRLEHGGSCSSLAWYGDGQVLAVGLADTAEVCIWAIVPPRRLLVLGDLRGGQPAIGVSRSGQLLGATSLGAGGSVFWHPSGGKPLLRLPSGKMAYTRASTDGRLYATEWVEDRFRLHLAEPSPVLQTLARSPLHPRPAAWYGASAHKGGRLVAVGSDRGVSLFDLATGWDVGFLPLGSVVSPHFIPESGDLLTCSERGLFRWPVVGKDDGARLRLGPPERLPGPTGPEVAVASDRSGRVIALAAGRRTCVLRPEGPSLRTLGPVGDCRHVDVSPDGRWVVTGGPWGGGHADVWDSTTARPVHRWEGPDSIRPGWFSPDGRWLSGTAGRAALVGVGNWSEEPRPGWAGPDLRPFSPDGQLLLGQPAPDRISLHDGATGRLLTVLELPDQARPWSAAFTADGTRLLVSANDHLAIYVWDLPALRRRLAELGLDWDGPPAFTATSPRPVTHGPLVLDVVGADLATEPRKLAARERERALSDLFFNPFDPDAHDRLGRLFLDEGNPEEAHAHLTAALAFRPDREETLFARARTADLLERWSDAVADLTRLLERNPAHDEARALRAQLYRLMNRQAEAIADYSAMIARDPQETQFYERRAFCYSEVGDHARARADREQVVKRSGNEPSALNDLAWELVTGPPEQRDPTRAHELIRAALAQEPDDAALLNTLGLIQFRRGRYSEARAAIEGSLRAGKAEPDAFDLFLLSLCHLHLREPGEARSCFDRAVRWCETQDHLPPIYARELKALRAESEEALRSAPR